MTRCPRCHRESLHPTQFCRGCGAPLLLADDATPPPLQATLDLDRRAGGAEERMSAPEPTPSPKQRSAEPARSSERAALERSSWDLGRPAPPRDTSTRPAAALAPPGDALPEPEVDVLEIHVARAPGWRRAAAWAVDAVPFAVGGGALARRLFREAGAGLPAPPEGLDGILDLLARERLIAVSVLTMAALALAVYATLAHALAGATLGKRLFGLRVIGPDGAAPSPARSAARSALAVVSAGLVGLGFLLALFNRSGRTLHDLIARTWVVKAP